MSRYSGPLGKAFSGDRDAAMFLQGRARILVAQVWNDINAPPFNGKGSMHRDWHMPDGTVIHAYVQTLGAAPIVRTWIESPVVIPNAPITSNRAYPSGFIFIPVLLTNRYCEPIQYSSRVRQHTFFDIFDGDFSKNVSDVIEDEDAVDVFSISEDGAPLAWAKAAPEKCAWIVNAQDGRVESVIPWVKAYFGNDYWCAEDGRANEAFDVISWFSRCPMRIELDENPDTRVNPRAYGVIFHKLHVLFDTNNRYAYGLYEGNDVFSRQSYIVGASIINDSGKKLLVVMRTGTSGARLTVYSFDLTTTVDTEGNEFYSVQYDSEVIVATYSPGVSNTGSEFVRAAPNSISFDSTGKKFCFTTAFTVSEQANLYTVSFDYTSGFSVSKSTKAISEDISSSTIDEPLSFYCKGYPIFNYFETSISGTISHEYEFAGGYNYNNAVVTLYRADGESLTTDTHNIIRGPAEYLGGDIRCNASVADYIYEFTTQGMSYRSSDGLISFVSSERRFGHHIHIETDPWGNQITRTDESFDTGGNSREQELQFFDIKKGTYQLSTWPSGKQELGQLTNASEFTIHAFGTSITTSIAATLGNVVNTEFNFIQSQSARASGVIAYSFPSTAIRDPETLAFSQSLNISRIGDSHNPNRDILGVDDSRMFLGMLSRV